MHEIRLIPPSRPPPLPAARLRWHFLAPFGLMEIPVGYVRKDFSALMKIAENLLFFFFFFFFFIPDKDIRGFHLG